MNARCFSFLVLLLVGCAALPTESAAQAPLSFRTDQEHYDLQEDETIVVTVTNTSRRILFYNTCMTKEVHELIQDTVVAQIGFPVCRAFNIKALHPSESIVLRVSLVQIEKLQEQLHFEEDSRFRVLFRSFYWHTNYDAPDVRMDEALLKTNAFEIVL